MEYTASDGKVYKTQFYNLDAILSVGYRVNSVNATAFRRWATSILKQYLLRGYSINQQLMQMEDRIDRRLEAQHDEIQHIKEIQQKQQSQIDFFVRTSLPPVEGIFFDGQVWDAYNLLSIVHRRYAKVRAGKQTFERYRTEMLADYDAEHFQKVLRQSQVLFLRLHGHARRMGPSPGRADEGVCIHLHNGR